MWWQGKTVCSLCGHKQQSVIEIDEDQDEPIVAMECGNCNNMTATPE